MKTKKFTVKVNTNDEYDVANGPDYAMIVIDAKAAKHIRSMAKFVERKRILCTEEFDYTPDFKTEIGENSKGKPMLENWQGDSDVMCLRIYSHGFLWTGMLKNTQIHLETEEISLDAIKAVL